MEKVITQIGSPSNVELLLHYFCSPIKHPRADAPAIKDGTERLLELGAIEPSENSQTYKATSRTFREFPDIQSYKVRRSMGQGNMRYRDTN